MDASRRFTETEIFASVCGSRLTHLGRRCNRGTGKGISCDGVGMSVSTRESGRGGGGRNGAVSLRV